MNSPQALYNILMITQTLRQSIKAVVADLGLPQVEFTLDHPTDSSHGDYATNLALLTFPKLSPDQKKLYSKPQDLAQTIANHLLHASSIKNHISKIDVAGPGFINLYLSHHWLLSALTDINANQNFGHTSLLQGKKISVEFTDPNPFKEFHIGHLYSNSVGESIARIFEANGATVWRADFFGDVGMHVAKSIWGLLHKFSEDGHDITSLKNLSLNDRIEYLGQAYALGASVYEENEKAKENIKILNFLIFKAAQELLVIPQGIPIHINYDQFISPSNFDYQQIKEIYQLGRSWSLEYFETIYARTGTKFDGYYPESIAAEYGYQLVIAGLNTAVFKKGEHNAVIFEGETHGLHNRVFINALGLPTYETKDVGLAVAKYHDFAYDFSYNITGNEINEYMKVVLTALNFLRPDLASKTIHVGHGMVRLPEGKMSSRTGKIIRGSWLLDEAKTKIKSLIKNQQNFTSEEINSISEAVGLGAVKYAFLKQSIGNDINFDFETSLSFEGNSGPYLQYTFARCQSVLNKAHLPKKSDTPKELIFQPEELEIIRVVYRFPEIVQRSALEYAPHHLCTYLYQLATLFNTMYAKHPILTASDPKLIEFRLQLTRATAIILKNGLTLLGIPTPEKM